MHDNILLPIDLQHPESWAKALPVAKRLAAEQGVIHLLGIVHDFGSSMVATFLPRGYEEKILQAQKVELDRFADTHFDDPARVKVHVGHGHIAETILRAQEKYSADLIVMATDQPDELRSIRVSRDANAVARHSPVSVMIVR
ncbi:universal stress protein [Paracoccus sp. 1_MG-2023]|uniref:universal stress protein n=1 Tax=unclassified Paracoccus (in: a-proteobacteria) TaxID=2688777 RepID=UPI001C08A47A|nr:MULTISPECIES: universal stress protein [unclassified Paracoccus (in: a-proteobacteria)]MBU2956533.1 universal stress protein [Paracoccus sp. C2R09]MDO6670417.1 universal stress protein [Paracoccus sp. 1_MG-2023]